MKNLFTLAIMCVFALTVSAQKTNRTSAYSYMNKGEFKKAWEFINKAIEHPQTKEDAKTWKYRGDIIAGIIQSGDIELTALVGDSIQVEIKKSYENAMKFDEKGSVKKGLLAELNAKTVQYNIMGGKMYKDTNYTAALAMYAQAAFYSDLMGKPDTNSLFNAALSAQNAEMYSVAAELFGGLTKLNAFGVDAYILQISAYKLQAQADSSNQTENIYKAVKSGRTAYPDNKDLIMEELSYMLTSGKFDEAKSLMDLAIEKDPQNKLLYYNKGVIFSDFDTEVAAEAYKKAIEIDPNYVDAYLNLGSIYYNAGADLNNKANELDFRKDGAKIEKLQNEAKVELEKAKPILEKAHEIDPANRDIMESLKQLYVFLKDNEKYAEMKAKLAQ